jgi:hypothetical protein
VPETIYSPWYDWHPDPVEVIQGGDYGPHYNHEPELGQTPSTALALIHDSYNAANFEYHHTFANPDFPSDDPQCGFNSVQRGLSGDEDWAGFCPLDPPGDFLNTGGGPDFDTAGGNIGVGNSSRIGVGDIQSVTWIANIAGWQFKPWLLKSDYNVVMGDDALQEELLAAMAATAPGDGWTLEYEAAFPTMLSVEYAPDETVAPAVGDPYVNTGYNRWVEMTEGWGYYKTDDGFDYFGEGVPAGDVRANYNGGLADWETVPDHWMPTQGDDGLFVVPEDEVAATVALTTLQSSLMADGEAPPTAPLENTSGSLGRAGQILVFRLMWQLPRFRWVGESDGVVRAPRRAHPVNSPARGYPRQRRQLDGNRGAGTYL